MYQQRRLQKKIMTGQATMPVAILIAIVCWVGTLLLWTHTGDAHSKDSLWDLWVSSHLPVWGNRTLSLLLYGVSGYLLTLLNNQFALIRTRASAQTTIFLLLTTACPLLHTFHAGTLAGITWVLSLSFLFRSYQDLSPESCLFHSFAFLSLGSLVSPEMLLLMPCYWMGAYMFRSLQLRSFLASLLGCSLPYWFLLGHALFHGQMELFDGIWTLSHLGTLHPFHLALWQWVTLFYLFMLYIVSTIHSLLTGYDDKLRTRAYLQFLMLLIAFLFLGTLLFTDAFNYWLSLLILGVSILSGHLFVLTQTRASNLFFIGSAIGLVALFCFNLCQL